MTARIRYLSCLRASVCDDFPNRTEKEKIRRHIVDWIIYRKYWDKDDSIERLSVDFGIPREEVTEFLYEKTGSRYLSIRKELRIEDAEELLLCRRDLNVYDIARMVGFTDKSNFRREFSEAVGVKPTEWRECNGNKKAVRISGLSGTGRNHSLLHHTTSSKS